MTDSKIIHTKTFDITKTNSITIQISNFKWKDLLNIYKSTFSDRYTWIVKNNSIAFQVEQLELLKEIIMVYEYNNSIKLMTLPKDIKFDSAPYKLPENYEWVENQMNIENLTENNN